MRSLSRQLKRGLLKLVLLWAIASTLLVGSLRVADPPVWAWRVVRSLDPPSDYPSRISHHWVSLDQIAPAMQLAVIAAEDQRFPTHWGIDLQAVWRALKANQQGSRLRGGSTLTQQTAKNLFLYPNKSLLRKAFEAYFAGLMELMWSKGRILEIYLNIAEFGPGLYGIEAASRHYFGIPAAELSAAQAARLAAVLPNPYRLRADRPSDYLDERAGWIQQQMAQLGPATLAQLDG